jgi:tryptophan-rich sensory protein
MDTILSSNLNEATQYQNYIQPEWAPPSWLFGPVWSVLYAIIFITFSWVFYKVYKGEIPKTVALPFALNLFFNAAFTPLQFGLQNNFLAAIDIVLVLVTILWFMAAIWKHNKWIAIANIPYLAWVSFATVLQITITVLNA